MKTTIRFLRILFLALGPILQLFGLPAIAAPLQYGECTENSIDQSLERDSYTFAAQAGDVVLIRVNRTSGSINPYLELLSPTGTRIAAGGPIYPYERAEILDQTLLTAGLYTLVVRDDNERDTGGYALSLQCTNHPGNAHPITYGSFLSGNVASKSQMVALQFSAKANDVVLIRMNRTSGEINPYLELFDPAGKRVDTKGPIYPYERAEILDQKLAADGLYTLILRDDNGNQTGSYGLSLQCANHPGNPFSLAYGSLFQGAIGNVSEMVAFRFEALAGDIVLMRINRTSGTMNPYLELFDPTGKRVATKGPLYPYERAEILDQTLTVAGKYTLFVRDDDGNQTGMYALCLQSANRPGNPHPIAYGSFTAGNVANKSQMEALQFPAKANNVVLIRMNRTSGEINPYLELFDPAGKRVDTKGPIYPYERAEILDQKLAADGLYTLIIRDDDGNQAGSYGLSLQCANDPGNPVSIAYGSLFQGAIGNVSEMVAFRFEALAGDIVLMRINRTSGTMNPYLELFDPAGKRVATKGPLYPYERAEILDQSLSSAGWYTLIVRDDNGNEMGGYAISLQSTNRPGQVEAITCGSIVQGTITTPSQMKTYQFFDMASDSARITMARTSGSMNPYLELFSPAGARLETKGPIYPYDRAQIPFRRITQSGTYTLIVRDDDGNQAGGYSLKLECQPPVYPDISIQPLSLNFGQVILGQHAERNFVVRNEGTSDLDISQFVLSDAGNFTMGDGAGSFTLKKGASQNVIVRFKPSSVGLKKTTLKVFSNDPDENPVIISLEGEATTPPELPEDWKYAFNTGNNATIVLPDTANPTVDGVPLLNGDYVGVFTPSGRCCGWQQWQGVNLAITAWGDDDQTAIVDGFVRGEEIHYRIYRRSEIKEWRNVSVRYSEGDAYYTANAYKVISRFLASEQRCQVIYLANKWSMFSLNVIPENLNVAAMTASIRDRLKIVKSSDGKVYIPAHAINDIGKMDVKQGYWIYLTDPDTLEVCGQPVPADTPIYLPAGWSMISYLPDVLMNAPDALVSIKDHLVLAKDGKGRSYIPAYGINDIGMMGPGQGYQVYLTAADTLIFPSSPLAKVSAVEHAEVTYFQFTSRTGDNATVVVTTTSRPCYSDGVPLTDGDEIGVFTSGGRCCGATVWQGQNAAITVWGDDSQTPEVDGFKAGDTLTFRIWRKGAQTEYYATAQEQAGVVPVYQPNGYFVLSALNAGPVVTCAEHRGEIPRECSLEQNYPNPFNPATTIAFATPQDGEVRIKVYDLLGKQVATVFEGRLKAGVHLFPFHAAQLASGVYFYRVESANFVDMKKMTLTK